MAHIDQTGCKTYAQLLDENGDNKDAVETDVEVRGCRSPSSVLSLFRFVFCSCRTA